MQCEFLAKELPYFPEEVLTKLQRFAQLITAVAVPPAKKPKHSIEDETPATKSNMTDQEKIQQLAKALRAEREVLQTTQEASKQTQDSFVSVDIVYGRPSRMMWN